MAPFRAKGARTKKFAKGEYEVEKIVDYVKEHGKEWYRVKWVGYSSRSNTWEPAKHLSNCTQIIKHFHQQQKGHKRQLNKSKLESLKRSKLESSPQRGKQLLALKDWQSSMNQMAERASEAPITVENNVDLEGPPRNFEYINTRIPGPGVELPSDPLIGCECQCCQDESKQCCAHLSKAVFAYNSLGCVRVRPGKPIFECNGRCKCSPKCRNRVVQRGRQVKVALFRTSNGCGWGVRTLEDIRKNSFVMEYVGEVITFEEAEKRGKVYDADGRTYLMDLDYNGDDCPYTVDAGYYGNVSHFVNHSCDPNLEVYGVWIDCLDPRLPRIALFACKHIKAGQELTFDYRMTGATNDAELGSPPKIPCKCGSEKCKTFLF